MHSFCCDIPLDTTRAANLFAPSGGQTHNTENERFEVHWQYITPLYARHFPRPSSALARATMVWGRVIIDSEDQLRQGGRASVLGQEIERKKKRRIKWAAENDLDADGGRVGYREEKSKANEGSKRARRSGKGGG